jgi:hypothetical protein
MKRGDHFVAKVNPIFFALDTRTVGALLRLSRSTDRISREAAGVVIPLMGAREFVRRAAALSDVGHAAVEAKVSTSYFKCIHVRPLVMRVFFRRSARAGEVMEKEQGSNKMLALLFDAANLDNVMVRPDALLLDHVIGSTDEIARRVFGAVTAMFVQEWHSLVLGLSGTSSVACRVCAAMASLLAPPLKLLMTCAPCGSPALAHPPPPPHTHIHARARAFSALRSPWQPQGPIGRHLGWRRRSRRGGRR